MYPRIAQLRTPQQFAEHIRSLGIKLGFDPELQSAPASPLAQSYLVSSLCSPLSNRFCILPMEGWDGTTNGRPTDLTIRRWQRFGQSGAKLIWGGEAVAVRPDGRANPNQLVINDANLSSLAALRLALVDAHAATGPASDLFIGLQLTHSGRFSKPNDPKHLEPVILYQRRRFRARLGGPVWLPANRCTNDKGENEASDAPQQRQPAVRGVRRHGLCLPVSQRLKLERIVKYIDSFVCIDSLCRQSPLVPVHPSLPRPRGFPVRARRLRPDSRQAVVAEFAAPRPYPCTRCDGTSETSQHIVPPHLAE